MTRWKRSLYAVGMTIMMALTSYVPAFAHEAPDDGAEWLMADWMLMAFLVFFSAALLAFIAAWKRGMFHNLEQAKYHVLTIDEADYYTPEWAKEE